MTWKIYIVDGTSSAMASCHSREKCSNGDGRGDGEIGLYYGNTMGAGDGPGNGWSYDCEFGHGHGYGKFCGTPEGGGYSRGQWLAP